MLRTGGRKGKEESASHREGLKYPSEEFGVSILPTASNSKT